MSTFPPNYLALGLFGAASFLALSEARPRCRSEWLDVFSSWAGPPSDSEDEKVARTERMVRDALTNNPRLISYDILFLLQGSSANNTNVKRTSDLDIVVVNDDHWSTPAPGEELPFIGTNQSFVSEYMKFRARVYEALQDSFGIFQVSEGRKCLKIAASQTTRVQCDLLPTFRLHQYLPHRSKGLLNSSPLYYEGVIFLDSGHNQIMSYPEQHLTNGREKNTSTGYRFKQIVRILKKLKSNFVDRETLLGADTYPSSFEIECAVYNVPDHLLTTGDLFDGVVNVLKWINANLSTGSGANSLKRCNDIERLFPYWRENSSYTLLGSGLLESGPPSEVMRFSRFVQRIMREIGAID